MAIAFNARFTAKAPRARSAAMMKRIFSALALSAVLTTTAHSEIVFQSGSFEVGLGGPSELVFDPFDPALGTLTRVEVSLSGVMRIEALAGAFAIPYTFSINSFLNAISPGGTGFEFGSPARWTVPFAVSGVAQTVQATSLFGLDFAFAETSDLLGFTTIGGMSGFTTPPVTINGRRGDFVEGPLNAILGIRELFVLPQLPEVIGAPVSAAITAASFDGLMQLTYVYEERAAVPEPSTALLLGLGLLFAAVHRRRIGAS